MLWEVVVLGGEFDEGFECVCLYCIFYKFILVDKFLVIVCVV